MQSLTFLATTKPSSFSGTLIVMSVNLSVCSSKDRSSDRARIRLLPVTMNTSRTCLNKCKSYNCMYKQSDFYHTTRRRYDLYREIYRPSDFNSIVTSWNESWGSWESTQFCKLCLYCTSILELNSPALTTLFLFSLILTGLMMPFKYFFLLSQ